MTGRDERQVSSLRELPQEIAPARDLWPGIAARINEIQAAAPSVTGANPIPPRRSGARLRWLAAAAMVASVAVGVWIGRSLLPAGRSPARPRRRTWPPAGGGDAPPGRRGRARCRLRERSALPARSVRRCCARSQSQLAALPPPTRAKVMASLATIEEAPSRISSRRSARIRAMRCCRSCSSTLTRMKCASSPTCAKPATLAEDLNMRVVVMCPPSAAVAERERGRSRLG